MKYNSVRKLVWHIADKFDDLQKLRGAKNNCECSREDFSELIALLHDITETSEGRIQVIQVMWIAAMAEWKEETLSGCFK